MTVRTMLRKTLLALAATAVVLPAATILPGTITAAHAESPSTSKGAKPGRKANRLAGIQSPYLEQHVYNAIDWYPWGPEALERAKRENKPIFVSVGYSTCYWCHVMARESFDNDEIGAFINKHFVPIKIDRERRPDLDEQFMLATQIMTGVGGWPNSVFLTADAKPFYGGTYMPPERFLDVSRQIEQFWRNEREGVEADAKRVSEAVVGYFNRTAEARALTPQVMGEALVSLFQQVDWQRGGLGQAPKFPQETALMLLMDRAERGDPDALAAVGLSLDAIIRGGITDHVGGGFHRYAVDADWTVPHFEKMLYNQALIGGLLVRMHALTGMERYRFTAERAFDYVIRELQEEGGGFHAAQDAESVGPDGKRAEGAFFVWSKDEFDKVVEKHPLMGHAYPVTTHGNFRGANVITMGAYPGQLAEASDMSEVEVFAALGDGLDALLDMRDERDRPHQDRKILVAWNAMMIRTLAEASTTFDRSDYHEAAAKAATYILDTLLKGDELKRSSLDGKVDVIDAQLSDYAGLGVALMALVEHAPKGKAKPRFLETAKKLADIVQTRFAKPGAKGPGPLQMTRVATGFAPFPPMQDEVGPSGNALAVELFDAIARHEGEPALSRRASEYASVLAGYALDNVQRRGALMRSVYRTVQGHTGLTRRVAEGKVAMRAIPDWENHKVRIVLDIADGWHVNSNKPLEKDFIATELRVDDKPAPGDIYPAPKTKPLTFNDQPLSLYEGKVAFEVDIPPAEQPGMRKVAITIQTCSDRICLQPEDVELNLWM